MKIFITLLFFISLGLLPLGLFLRAEGIVWGDILFALGLSGLFLYFIARTIKHILKNRMNKGTLLLQIYLILTTVVLFAKYFYYSFIDYIGPLIILIFVIAAIFYLIRGRAKYGKLTAATIVYLFLIIPLLGLPISFPPNPLVPAYWYKKIKPAVTQVEIDVPEYFRYEQTRRLWEKGNKLKMNGRYASAIGLYNLALKIEPRNERVLFDLANGYFDIGYYGQSIDALNSGIAIDSSFPGFYNNRGLCYYKIGKDQKAIVDYKKAIAIDSTNYSFFVNLALAYNALGAYKETCATIKKLGEMGFEVEKLENIRKIRAEKCIYY